MKFIFVCVSVGLAAFAAGGCDSESSDDPGTQAGAAGTGGAAGKGGSAGSLAGTGSAGTDGRSGAVGSGGAAGAGASGAGGEGGVSQAGGGGAGGSSECWELRGYPVGVENWCIDMAQPEEVLGRTCDGCPAIIICVRRPSDGKYFASHGCVPEGWQSCEREDEWLDNYCVAGGAGGEGGIGGGRE